VRIPSSAGSKSDRTRTKSAEGTRQPGRTRPASHRRCLARSRSWRAAAARWTRARTFRSTEASCARPALRRLLPHGERRRLRPGPLGGLPYEDADTPNSRPVDRPDRLPL
jgi:hypothetical protein